MAKKRGPIGKVESFYIEKQISTKTLEEIATDLDRSIASVRKFVDKHKIKKETKPSPVYDQFARSKGSVVMTENASSMSESKPVKKNILKNSCVTKIK